MFSTVFRWESRALRRDPACAVALALAVAAIVFALINGTRWRTHLDTTAAAAIQNEQATRKSAKTLATRLDAKPDPSVSSFQDPRVPATYANRLMAHYAVLPATPLAALSAGQSDLLPSVLPLAPGANPSLASGAEPENPHRLLIGRFDAAFVIVFLAPLFVIALTYALLAAERERGTLALLLAQPLSLRTLLVGQLAPRLLLGIGLLALLGGLFAVASSDASASTVRFALWFAVAFGYGAFWFALAVAVIARSGGTATHAVALTALWLALTLLVPAGINLAVKTLHPVPSRVELILALRAATDRATAERSQVLAAYYEDHPEFAPAADAKRAAEDADALTLAANARIERDLAPVLAHYDAQLARQQSLVEKLQFLSPALLVQSALADAAGTSLARHRWFFAQALAHHRELRGFFDPRSLRKEKFAAWDEVPTFHYVEESTSVVAKRVLPAMVVLMLAAFTFALVGWRALRHSPLTS